MGMQDYYPPRRNLGVTGHRKTEARLMAVQAMYQMMLMQADKAKVEDEFVSFRMQGIDVDKNLFKLIFAEAAQSRPRYEQMIANHLRSGWSLDRVGLTERAIMLAAIAELEAAPDTPKKVVINEFINIAGSFLDDEDMRFINSVLDKIATDIRGA